MTVDEMASPAEFRGWREASATLDDVAGGAIEGFGPAAADDSAGGDSPRFVDGQLRLDRSLFALCLRARRIIICAEDGA